MHDLSLIATIAAGFSAAWLLGLLTQWLRLSPIVGYLLAGVLIGPHTPGFVGDLGVATQLAEVGVILLMFGVGLHFHLRDLLAVRRIAVPGAVVQSLFATLAAMALFWLFGMKLVAGAVLGMAMAVASTVVLMRMLMDANLINSREGHTAVGWLIVEDIFTVILLVLIPVLGAGMVGSGEGATASAFGMTLGWALLKLGVLTFVVLWAGSRIIPRLLVRVAKLRSRELFTLTVLVFSVAVAAASYFFFGASMALGAFLAGMVVAQSPVSHQAAADALPLRDAFAVLFFVSVGMLFDPAFLLQEPLMVLAALAVILVVKPLAALFIVAVLGHSVRTGLTVALGLAQIGEFSFILSELARRHGLMPDAGHHVLVAAAILSITLNPFLFRRLPRIEGWLRARPALWSLLNRRAERRLAAGGAAAGAVVEPHSAGARAHASPFAVLVGYGPVGRTVHRVLEESGMEVVVIDLNMDTVAELAAAGKAALFGDASKAAILEEAGVANAACLVVTVPDPAQRAAVITAARSMNRAIRIVARARYLRERAELEHHGVSASVFEEAEAAVALARVVLADTGVHREAARTRLQEIRFQLALESLPELRRLTVTAAMLPWARVRALPADLDRAAALARIEEQPHRYFPVVDPGDGRPLGYVVADELAADPGKSGWVDLVRPCQMAAAGDSIGEVFARMCEGGPPVCIVRSGELVMGLVTRGHLLDRVEADFSKVRPRQTRHLLGAAVVRGGMVPALAATTREAAIRELAAAVSARFLPPGVDTAKIADLVFAREEEIPTDLGNGIALPHARCDGLAEPLAVIGHSHEGIAFSDSHHEGVRLFFLLVTPSDRPETHLALLSEVARLVSNRKTRAALLAATTPVEVLELIE